MLKPVNPDFGAIELSGSDEGNLRVVAEFLEVVGNREFVLDAIVRRAS